MLPEASFQRISVFPEMKDFKTLPLGSNLIAETSNFNLVWAVMQDVLTFLSSGSHRYGSFCHLNMEYFKKLSKLKRTVQHILK